MGVGIYDVGVGRSGFEKGSGVRRRCVSKDETDECGENKEQRYHEEESLQVTREEMERLQKLRKI
jgi:hypothetical protein